MAQIVEMNLDSLGYKKAAETNEAEIWVNSNKAIVACIITSEYIPIEDFKELFDKISVEVLEGKLTKFIFDKRALRTFHQPSMEWYYISWKTEMVQQGLVQHRKILPDLQWFVKAVEIAKKPLLNKMSLNLVEKLDIQYCQSIQEATEI